MLCRQMCLRSNTKNYIHAFEGGEGGTTQAFKYFCRVSHLSLHVRRRLYIWVVLAGLVKSPVADGDDDDDDDDGDDGDDVEEEADDGNGDAQDDDGDDDDKYDGDDEDENDSDDGDHKSAWCWSVTC